MNTAVSWLQLGLSVRNARIALGKEQHLVACQPEMAVPGALQAARARYRAALKALLTASRDELALMDDQPASEGKVADNHSHGLGV